MTFKLWQNHGYCILNEAFIVFAERSSQKITLSNTFQRNTKSVSIKSKLRTNLSIFKTFKIFLQVQDTSPVSYLTFHFYFFTCPPPSICCWKLLYSYDPHQIARDWKYIIAMEVEWFSSHSIVKWRKKTKTELSP